MLTFKCAGALAVCALLFAIVLGDNTALAAGEPYAYKSPEFTRFVADSCRATGAGNPQAFYRWMDGAYGRSGLAGKGARSWDEMLSAKRAEFARISDPAKRAKAEMALGRSLHRAIKTIIPRFSLERGFEFTYAARRGERQCFLQSVLIAGLLQKAGVDAGIAMVYRNDKGRPLNNAHAVTVVRLADGRDVLIDASRPHPFARHRGLFLADGRTGAFRYVDPVFAGQSPVIAHYLSAAGRARMAARGLRPLPTDFLRSQFTYYRGERAPGGILSGKMTPAGLESATRHLRASIQQCPQNPLPVYMLGRVYQKQKNLAAARRQFEQAERLYAGAGWVPAGAKEALAQTRSYAAVPPAAGQRKAAGD